MFIRSLRKPVVFVITVLLIFGTFFSAFNFIPPAKKAKAADNPVYLHYADNTTNANIFYAYQKINAVPNSMDWIRYKLFQYDSGKAWDMMGTQLGRVNTSTGAQYKDAFTYTNGSGDGGTWINVTDSGKVYKKRAAGASYTPYSAYATITVTADTSDLFFGYLMIGGVSGYARIKINGSISTTGQDLNASGELNMSHSGSSVQEYAHIAKNVHTGDVVTIELKGPSTNIYIYNLVGGVDNVVPGDSNWFFAGNPIQYTASADTVTLFESTANSFFGGPAHPGHEYNPVLTLTLNGTTIVPGTNIILGGVLVGVNLNAIVTGTVYKTVMGGNDFGTLIKNFTWSGNQLVEAWQLNFTTDTNIITAYIHSHSFTGCPAANPANTIFRYANFGGSSNVQLPFDNSPVSMDTGPSSVSNGNFSFFGGDSGLKMTHQSSVIPTKIFMGGATQKMYQKYSPWEKTFHNGDSIANSTTVTFDYENPINHNWGNQTLFVSLSADFSLVGAFAPFNGNNVIVKSRAGTAVGLTFGGVAPARTLFTSYNDDSAGVTLFYSTHTPAKGDWAGVTVNGAVNAANNIINYTTTGITLTGNANAYGNSFNQNTTGINAAAGSTVKNNALTNQTINTAGAGSFDYNAFVGNAEARAVNANPLFTNAAGGDFSLQSNSPAIDAGYDTGITTDYVGNSIYGNPDIGVYEYQPPHTIGTDKIDIGAGARVYGNGKFRDVITTNSTQADLKITPSGGTFSETTSPIPAWLDISGITWSNTGNHHKVWTESNAEVALNNTEHEVGDLEPNKYYNVKVDNVLGANITGEYCTAGKCLANNSGKITFTYTGGYSTHTFDVEGEPATVVTPVIPSGSSNSSTPATPSTLAAKFPDTGVAPSRSSFPWSVTILAGVLALSTLFVVIRRKKRAI